MCKSLSMRIVGLPLHAVCAFHHRNVSLNLCIFCVKVLRGDIGALSKGRARTGVMTSCGDDGKGRALARCSGNMDLAQSYAFIAHFRKGISRQISFIFVTCVFVRHSGISARQELDASRSRCVMPVQNRCNRFRAGSATVTEMCGLAHAINMILRVLNVL